MVFDFLIEIRLGATDGACEHRRLGHGVDEGTNASKMERVTARRCEERLANGDAAKT